MVIIHQRHRQTDGQTTCDRKTALCTIVHRALTKQKAGCKTVNVKPTLHCESGVVTIETARRRASVRFGIINTLIANVLVSSELSESDCAVKRLSSLWLRPRTKYVALSWWIYGSVLRCCRLCSGSAMLGFSSCRCCRIAKNFSAKRKGPAVYGTALLLCARCPVGHDDRHCVEQ